MHPILRMRPPASRRRSRFPVLPFSRLPAGCRCGRTVLQHVLVMLDISRGGHHSFQTAQAVGEIVTPARESEPVFQKTLVQRERIVVVTVGIVLKADTGTEISPVSAAPDAPPQGLLHDRGRRVLPATRDGTDFATVEVDVTDIPVYPQTRFAAQVSVHEKIERHAVLLPDIPEGIHFPTVLHEGVGTDGITRITILDAGIYHPRGSKGTESQTHDMKTFRFQTAVPV